MRRFWERVCRVLNRQCPDCGATLSDSGVDYVTTLQLHKCDGAR